MGQSLLKNYINSGTISKMKVFKLFGTNIKRKYSDYYGTEGVSTIYNFFIYIIKDIKKQSSAPKSV